MGIFMLSLNRYSTNLLANFLIDFLVTSYLNNSQPLKFKKLCLRLFN